MAEKEKTLAETYRETLEGFITECKLGPETADWLRSVWAYEQDPALPIKDKSLITVLNNQDGKREVIEGSEEWVRGRLGAWTTILVEDETKENDCNG